MAAPAGKCYDIYMEISACQSNTEETAVPQRRSRTLLLGLLGFLLALGILLLWVYHGITPVVFGEYGEGVPPASAFCSAADALCLTDERCAALGGHIVPVMTGIRVAPCLLIVRDTTAPSAVPVRVEFASGYEPTPDEFITGLVDADRVGVRFAEAYDFSPAGEQPVRIFLEDGSGNRSEVTATAVVRAAVEQVVVEAGSPAPSIDPFLTEGFHGQLLDLITDEMMQTPGEYPLRIQCPENGRIFTTVLTVRDTVAPIGKGRLLVLAPGETAVPEAFISDVSDETALSFAFATAPDPDSREIQDILIRVKDAGGNAADVSAQVLISSLGTMVVEAKNGPLTGADLGCPEGTPEPFWANTLGTYPIRVRVGQETEIAMVTLVDTTGPVLTQREGPFFVHHDLTPEQLVTAEDVSAVTLSFQEAPDQNSEQPQTFTVRAVDALGNETAAAFPLTLLVDTTPPVLYGVVNRTGYVNEPIAYLAGAYAEDEADGRVDVTVESTVILSRKGKYTVTYTATDKSGNTASKSCTYTLVEPTVSEQQVREAARKVLEKITTDDMVPVEKLRAVYDYLHGSMRFSGSSNKADWRKEALRGLTTHRGDCFTYFSAARALLDELDIPYLCVTRKSNTSRHYWVIVNVGTGWYHFDPINYYSWNRCFMWTNQQCQVKTIPEFWRFHEENYPPIATEPFDYNAVVQMERDGLLP